MTTIATTTEMEIIFCFLDAPIAFRNFLCCQVAAASARVPRAMRLNPRFRGACRTPDVAGGNFFGLVLEELVNGETESDH